MITAIVLAGGQGTRLRSVVSDVPKPMAPINGRPFLGYLLDYWIAQGVTRFVISVGYKGEVIVGHFGDVYQGVPVSYVVEDSPLGTGGGMLLAARDLRGAFLVLNGDTLFTVELNTLLEFHSGKSSDWSVCLFRTNEIGRYMGVEVDSDAKICSLKTGDKNCNRLANGGVYLVSPSALMTLNHKAGSRASIEDDLLQRLLMNNGRLFGLESSGSFLDIGVPSDYFRAGEFLGALPKKMS